MKQPVQMQIAAPCGEDWNSMSPTQQGRFCMSCKKEVVDFSAMTDKEILEHISAATKSICGRADNHQLNRVLVVPPEPRKIWWRYWMGIAASFVIITSKSHAQVKVPANIAAVAPALMGDTSIKIVVGKMSRVPVKEIGLVAIEGTVMDDTSNPIAFASVKLTNSSIGVAADAAGHFALSVNASLSKLVLEVSAVGYESTLINLVQRENIQSSSTERNTIKLITSNIKLKQLTMGEVVVVAPPRLKGRVGGLTAVCVRYTRYEKIKDILTGNTDIKVYPNPVSINNSFKLVFNLRDAGEYFVQFTDASGKIIAGKQLDIAMKNQLESFNGNMFAAAGLYFAIVGGKHSQRIYTTRLVVQ